MMPRSPSTTWVSLSSAFMESFVRAFSTSFVAVAAMRACDLGARRRPPGLQQREDLRHVSTWSTRPRGSTSSAIWRMDLAVHLARGRRPPRSAPLLEKPSWRPATTTLAARRLTSHSQGPGSVSSKSLQSKTSWRSGDPKTPKLERWASPQIWAVSPERGVVERSDAMISAAPRKKVNGETSIRP